MSLVFLAISFVTSGLSSIVSKLLIELHLKEFQDIYLLSNYVAAMLLGFVLLRATAQKGTVQDSSVGMAMGFFGCAGFILFLLVLSRSTGIVAFPLRSLGNLILTALISMLAWKDKLSKSQWVGLGLSLVAIWLIY
jgi:drug/metabolite transporter (DMT)-like permease